MATIPLPTALERIVDVATMPDGAAINYNEFIITAPSPLVDADSGKSFEVKIEPIDPYKYVGAISVQYDKINLASLPPLVSDRKVDDLLSNRSLFLSTLSQRFGVKVLSQDFLPTPLSESSDENNRKYFIANAAPNSPLWYGALKVEQKSFKFGGTVEVNTLMLVSCDVNITLHAIIVGDTLGHTLEWVQLSGTPVAWLEDTHQATVMFEQPQVRDDKVFRFYVDRGTEEEIYREVLTTTVMRDTAPLMANVSNQASLVPWLNDETVSLVSLIPALSLVGAATSNNPGRLLSWANPTVNYLAYNTVYYKNTSGQSVQTSVAAGNYLPAAKVNTAYQIKSTLSYFGITRTTESAKRSFTLNPNVIDADASDEMFIPTSVNASTNLSVLERFTRELIGMATPDESAVLMPTAGPSSVSVLERITRELIGMETLEEPARFWMSSSEKATLKILEVSTVGLTSIG